MKLKNALQTIRKEHTADTLRPLYTPWGETLDADHVLEEYPRPQLRRKDYHSLNGYWDYCFGEATPGVPFAPDGQILVPFSPESLLSGVNRQLKPGETLWYQRTITLTRPNALLSRCLLHFDAVDQEATVYLNGEKIAEHHCGYLPFTVEFPITTTTDPSADHFTFLLQICVRDHSDTSYYSRGKQSLKRGGMFYTAQSGIWQSVWYEWVPANPIEALYITPDYEKQQFTIQLRFQNALSDCPTIQIGAASTEQLHQVIVEKSLHETILEKPTDKTPFHQYTLICSLPAELPFCPWTPQDPHLYPVTITADEDIVESYFAMRTFTIEKDASGIPRFCLNHKPIFLHGILDQGYWSDGLMTAPSDEALQYDIKLVKSLGFNMIRKHIKIERLRFYYHCDRIGMIVWQDMVNGGKRDNMLKVCYLPTLFSSLGKARMYPLAKRLLLTKQPAERKQEWTRECEETIRHLYNVPSIAAWVPFNEGWGQFDTEEVCSLIRGLDATRQIDAASGWFDCGAGDFVSVHNYFRPLKVKTEKERAFVLSEYGGYACHIAEHSSVDRTYGYRKYESCEQLSAAYQNLIEKQLHPLIEKGLCGAVYTQISDIEEEVNGLVTYDRRIVKMT